MVASLSVAVSMAFPHQDRFTLKAANGLAFGEAAKDGSASGASDQLADLPNRSVSLFADFSFANVVYRGPCIEPVGASADGIGPIGLAFSEKINLYFPSPYGSIRSTGA